MGDVSGIRRVDKKSSLLSLHEVSARWKIPINARTAESPTIKLHIPVKSQYRRTKFRRSAGLRLWNFEFAWDLELGI
jgi:hypothetical protein